MAATTEFLSYKFVNLQMLIDFNENHFKFIVPAIYSNMAIIQNLCKVVYVLNRLCM